MRTPVSGLTLVGIAVLAAALVVGTIAGPAEAGSNPNVKVAVHLKDHNTTCKTLPTFTACTQMVTSRAGLGDLDAIPVFFDLTEYTVIEFGLTWPSEWLSMSWFRCRGSLAIGTIVNPGDGTAISYGLCTSSWAAAPGYGWLASNSAGTITMIPNPATGDIGVVDCAPSPGPYRDIPIANYYAGVGGVSGLDPCVPPTVPPTLLKTDDIGASSCAFPDSDVVYTLKYRNTNSTGLTEVTLVDSLASQVDFVSATGSYTYDAGTRSLTWAIGSLAAGDSNSVTVTVHIKPATPVGSTIVNNARIFCNETSAVNTAQVTTNVCACSIISGPTLVCPGVTSLFYAPDVVGFTYQWSVTGNGSIPGGTTSRGVNVVAGSICDSTYTLHLTVTSAGIPSQCQRVVTVDDTQAPTISSSPGNLTVSCLTDVPRPNTGSVTGFDNCSVFNVAFVGDDTTGTACNLTITRTYRASDACGNFTDALQTIAVHDTTDPVIACPAGDTLQCPSEAPAADTTLVTASDNCGVVTVTFVGDVLNGSDCDGTLARTYRATDPCGNFAECVQTFTLADTTKPYFTTPCPADTTVECNGIPPVPVITAADNCGEANVGYDLQMTPGSCANNYTQTRTWTATDGCGNSVQCQQIITVVDTEAPTLVCAPDDTVACGTTPVFTDPTVSDDCDPTPRLDHTDSSVPGPNPGEVTHTRTWTATDACGNVSDPCTQTILVEACAFVPVTANKNDGVTGCVYPGGGITYTISYNNPNEIEVHGVEVTDTLSTSLNFVSASNGGSYNAGNRTVTWSIGTLAVGGGGSLTLSVTVGASVTPGTTVHNIAVTFCDEAGTGSSSDEATPICACLITGPSTVCPGDTVQYSGPASMTSYSWSITGTGSLVGATNARNVNVITGGCATSFTLHLEVNQGGGVISQCDKAVNAQDITQPVITCASNLTIQCWESTLPARTGSASATDDCDLTPTVSYSDSVAAGTCPQKHVITRTWTATDDCSNSASCKQTITVTDTGAPVFTSHPNDTTVQCSSNVPAPSPESCTATDSCGTVTIIFFSDVSNGGTCPEIITRTYKATDQCGNASNATQLITVDDTIAPTLVCAPDDTVSCGSDIVFTDPTVSDNCDPSPVLNHTDSANSGPGEVIHTRCWTATDACGNVSLECCQNIVETGCGGCFIAGVTETCPGATNQYCVAEGMDLYSWTVFGSGSITGVSDQACVNVVAGLSCSTSFMVVAHVEVGSSASDCSLTVVVRDVADPEITASPADTSVQCSSDVPTPNIGLVTATDNCSEPVVSWEGDVSDGLSCPEVITRTYRVSDDCDNFVDVEQHITVNDTIPPVISCPPDTIFECDNVGDAGEATATDNCTADPVVTSVDNVIPGTGEGCYTVERTWTATDACGNSSDCMQTITVVDGEPPTITCASSRRIGCTETLVFDAPFASDNCGTPIVTAISTDTTSVPGGEVEYTRCWEATDGCGNADSCCQTITREACPFVPLELTKSDDIATCVNPGGAVTYTISYNNPNAATVTGVVLTDSLPDSVSVVDSHGGVYNPGPPRTVTWAIGDLLGGGSGQKTLDVTVNSGVAYGSSFSNIAEVTSAETAPTTTSVLTDVCEFTYVALRLVKSDMLSGPAAPGDTIDYQIGVYNDNALPVTNIVVVDDLPSEVIFISATTPYSYDSGDHSVTWDLGQIDGASSVTLDLEVQVDPEAVSGSVINVVSATSDQTTTPGQTSETTRIVGGEVGVYFDIKPATCPNSVQTKAKGVLPAAVLGTETFDVRDIDPATIRLTREGFTGTVAPIRWSYEDVETPFEGVLCGCDSAGPDGHTDLTLKFSLPTVVSTLGLESAKGQTIELVIVGMLEDGTEIRGADCVQVLETASSTLMPSAGIGFESGAQVGMPESGQISLSFFTAGATRVRLDVFDVHGRLVKNLVDADVGAGSHVVTWNMTTESGLRVPAGIYFARVSGGRETATAKLVIVE